VIFTTWLFILVGLWGLGRFRGAFVAFVLGVFGMGSFLALGTWRLLAFELTFTLAGFPGLLCREGSCRDEICLGVDALNLDWSNYGNMLDLLISGALLLNFCLIRGYYFIRLIDTSIHSLSGMVLGVSAWLMLNSSHKLSNYLKILSSESATVRSLKLLM